MNSLLEHIYETGHVEDAQGNLIDPFPTATPSAVGKFLGEIVESNNLQKTLEIGMAYGLSSLSICQAHHDRGSGNHTAIDPLQTELWKSIGWLNIKRAGLEDRFRLFEERSDRVLPRFLIDDEKFDLVFIDGAHLFDYALVDFFYTDQLIRTGGYLVFDDIWMPGVRKVVSFILNNRNYELVKISTKPSLYESVTMIAKRFLQNPFDFNDLRVKLIPEQICLVRKISEDRRKWDFHKAF